MLYIHFMELSTKSNFYDKWRKCMHELQVGGFLQHLNNSVSAYLMPWNLIFLQEFILVNVFSMKFSDWKRNLYCKRKRCMYFYLIH